VDQLARTEILHADVAMSEARYGDARGHYARALALESRFWTRLALAEAWFQEQAWSEALDVYVAAHRAEPANAVGNPWFHLRVGQCLFELSEPAQRLTTGPSTAMDNLARALIGGGVALFDGEAPEYLAAVTQVLVPPSGMPSWEATRGAEAPFVERLEGAWEYDALAKLLIDRGIFE
jgi:hypothetical protein